MAASDVNQKTSEVFVFGFVFVFCFLTGQRPLAEFRGRCVRSIELTNEYNDSMAYLYNAGIVS